MIEGRYHAAVIFEEVMRNWRSLPLLTGPPSQPITLWAENTRQICVGNGWGPPVPYPPMVHGDGNKNFGYLRIKGADAASVSARLPEASDWPELIELLTSINATDSAFESVGCEKHFFPVPADTPEGGPTVYLGSYVNVIFTDASLNDQPEHALLLASNIMEATDGCERWWSCVEIEFERMKFLAGTRAPWGLLVRVMGYGRNETEARKHWGVTIGLIERALSKLARDFRWEGDGDQAQTGPRAGAST
jgi:hypothetical protein